MTVGIGPGWAVLVGFIIATTCVGWIILADFSSSCFVSTRDAQEQENKVCRPAGETLPSLWGRPRAQLRWHTEGTLAASMQRCKLDVIHSPV